MLDFFNNLKEIFGTIGLIATGSFFGSLIVVFVQHYFEKNKLKTERESLLAREIYFRLQDKAEKIRFGMQLLSRRMDKITLEIKLKVENGMVVENRLEDDYLDERINLAVYLETYFPSVNLKSYNDCINLIPKMVMIYKEFIENSSLQKEKIEELNKINQDFNSGMVLLSSQIQSELNKARSAIK